MDRNSLMISSCTLILPGNLADQLFAHLFPGDGDEHGAVITAGIARSSRGVRLLARDLFLARDGVDYVPGQRGYRMLQAPFVTDKVLYCRDEELCYLAVHNHGGTDRVQFSDDDLASHERGYRALLDVSRGMPVGGLVFSRYAAAGDIWLTKTERINVSETRILGSSVRRLYPSPPPRPRGRDETYDRQARLFGDAGQDLLAGAKVGIVGAGGVGSLLVEYLARLGVGSLVVGDPERLDLTNVPRVVGSTRRDARVWLTDRTRPEWMRRIGQRISARKVDLTRRVARAANPSVRFEGIFGNVVDDTIARRFADCDYLFLAADSQQARLVFNALVHQFLIPGVQVGSKVPVDSASGAVGEIFSVIRPISPSNGCLWCNGLISADGLQREAASPPERVAQQYVQEAEVRAPSVITLNATVASHAANDFLFAMTGLVREGSSEEYMRLRPRNREVWFDRPRRDSTCGECGSASYSRLARGDSRRLPTRV